MSRLGKMPHWQKWLMMTVMFSCSLSGIAYLIGHQFELHRQILGSHLILTLHGVGAMLATLALGTALPFHLKAGLQSKRKRVSGIGQLSCLGLLMVTGALLYYGSGDIRESAIHLHWVIGVLFFTIFILHVTKVSKQ